MAQLQTLPDLFNRMRKDLAEDVRQAVRESLHATLFAPTINGPPPSRKRKAVDLTASEKTPPPSPAKPLPQPLPQSQPQPLPVPLSQPRAQSQQATQHVNLVNAYDALPKEIRIMLRKRFMGGGKRGAASAEEKAHVMRQYVNEQREKKLQIQEQVDDPEDISDDNGDGDGSDSKTNTLPIQSTQPQLPASQPRVPVARALPGLSGVFDGLEHFLMQTPNA